MIRKYAEIFCWKNVSSFCSAKATHIFSAKNIRILCIESAKTVNEMALNKLVKLTTLWKTGPSTFLLKKCVLSGTMSGYSWYTVNYLEFQGTLWNTSRYPYFDISDLQNWGKKLIRLKLEIIENIVEKRVISPLFHNIFLPVVRFSYLSRDKTFTSR